MLRESLAALFRRDLAALQRELDAYPDEESIWRTVPGLSNSGGVLVRHVCGNLRHFVGGQLGGTGYQRNREAEFHDPPWARERLAREVVATVEAVQATLQGLEKARLEARFPQAVAAFEFGTADLLLHLATHLAFHLGQVDYHRRAVTGDPASVGPMALGALASARPLS
jgi:uncharacterized damage-inducible protein DinB